MSADAVARLYDRLEQLVQEAQAIQARVTAAAADNQSRDAQRVTPERRTHRRAHAHDQGTNGGGAKPGNGPAD